MMTDSQRRDKSRVTEALVSSGPSRVDDDEVDDDAETPSHPDAPLTGPCRTDNPHPGSRLRTNELRSKKRCARRETAICWGRVR